MDRNTLVDADTVRNLASPPARVAWIETIAALVSFSATSAVATREGGVDRNIGGGIVDWLLLKVATREGGVDRNSKILVY